jgi:hypothetical protein
MAIAILFALLIHVVWLARAYEHTNPATRKRVRSASSILSLIITTTALCLLVDAAPALKIFLTTDSVSQHGNSVTASPDNSACYAKYPKLDEGRN